MHVTVFVTEPYHTKTAYQSHIRQAQETTCCELDPCTILGSPVGMPYRPTGKQRFCKRHAMDRAGSPKKVQHRIICGDATEILQGLVQQADRFDVIIADPPYNIGKDFGTGSTPMPLPDYAEWAAGWINSCLDLLTRSGLLYVYGFSEVLAHVAVRYAPGMQRWLVWHYTNKTVPSYKFWQRSHETILCLWNPDHARPNLELDQIREPYTASFLSNAAGRKRKDTPSRYGKRGRDTVYKAHAKGALPRDVIKVPALAGGAGRSERWFMCRTCACAVYPPSHLAHHRDHDTFKHPTQKPGELTRKLIRSRISGQAGRVLIPFAGSGSECVVARDLGIDFVGIEINPDYVSFAEQWLARSSKEAEPCTA